MRNRKPFRQLATLGTLIFMGGFIFRYLRTSEVDLYQLIVGSVFIILLIISIILKR